MCCAGKGARDVLVNWVRTVTLFTAACGSVRTRRKGELLLLVEQKRCPGRGRGSILVSGGE